MTALAVVLVLSPVLVYLIAALMEKRRVVASSEFFLAAGQVSSFEFANSSIGYGFQIASVSIFSRGAICMDSARWSIRFFGASGLRCSRGSCREWHRILAAERRCTATSVSDTTRARSRSLPRLSH